VDEQRVVALGLEGSEAFIANGILLGSLTT